MTDSLILPDLTLPADVRHILVLGLAPGLGVTSTARWLAGHMKTAPATSAVTPPVITDGGFIHGPADASDQLRRFRTGDDRLADMVVLLRHPATAPEQVTVLLQALTTLYRQTGQPRPHIVVRTRGCGDAPDQDMAAKARLTDRLLLGLAAQVFAPDSADYAAAHTLFSPAESPFDSDITDKDNTE